MKDRGKFITGLILLTAALAIGIWQWNVRQAHVFTVEQMGKEAANLTLIKEELISEYQDAKVEVSAAREVAQQEQALVFPTKEDLTNLTRLMDDFALKNNFESNPFFISGLNYQSAQTDESGNYRYVMATVTVESSSKNLGKFIEFIENSGSLEGETRLMSIEEMNVGYPDNYGGTYDVRFNINAYFSREI